MGCTMVDFFVLGQRMRSFIVLASLAYMATGKGSK
jgi:hypothetical protein